jgi:antitoxin component YwqK of YwqJK toxin-antitoxin module
MHLPAILLALISTTIISSGEPTPKPVKVITANKIEKRNGIYYEVNQATPFTGVSQGFNPDGKKRSEVNYKDGEKHGVATLWRKDGTKMKETRYVYVGGPKKIEVGKNSKHRVRHRARTDDGKKHGVETKWQFDREYWQLLVVIYWQC